MLHSHILYHAYSHKSTKIQINQRHAWITFFLWAYLPFHDFQNPIKLIFFQLIVIRLKSQKKLSRIGCFSYNKTSATNQYTIYILTRPIEMIEDTINLHTY